MQKAGLRWGSSHPSLGNHLQGGKTPTRLVLYALVAGVKQEGGDREIFRSFHLTRGACNDFQGREPAEEAASREDAERTFVPFAFILHRFKASRSSVWWQA